MRACECAHESVRLSTNTHFCIHWFQFLCLFFFCRGWRVLIVKNSIETGQFAKPWFFLVIKFFSSSEKMLLLLLKYINILFSHKELIFLSQKKNVLFDLAADINIWPWKYKQASSQCTLCRVNRLFYWYFDKHADTVEYLSVLKPG